VGKNIYFQAKSRPGCYSPSWC